MSEEVEEALQTAEIGLHDGRLEEEAVNAR